MAQLIRGLKIFFCKADAAVVHKYDLVRKACGFVFALIIFPDFIFKIGYIVYGNGYYLIKFTAVRLLAKLRPQAAQSLRNYCSAVVVALDTAVFIADDKEYWRLSFIFGLRERSVQFIKAPTSFSGRLRRQVNRFPDL